LKPKIGIIQHLEIVEKDPTWALQLKNNFPNGFDYP